jgi:hypothetical protein
VNVLYALLQEHHLVQSTLSHPAVLRMMSQVQRAEANDTDAAAASGLAQEAGEGTGPDAKAEVEAEAECVGWVQRLVATTNTHLAMLEALANNNNNCGSSGTPSSSSSSTSGGAADITAAAAVGGNDKLSHLTAAQVTNTVDVMSLFFHLLHCKSVCFLKTKFHSNIL